MKECRDCGLLKELGEFPSAKKTRDGRGTYCRPCTNVRSKDSYRRRAAAKGKVVRERETLPAGMRRCPDCRQLKALADFPRNRSARGGRGSYCKPCHNVPTRTCVEKLHGSGRHYHLRQRYGIGAADVAAMIKAQGGVCLLCGERLAQHVDHDHVTGEVRGVLCSCCNQGLGNFRDNAAALRAAIDYLERTTWQRTLVCTGVYQLTSPRPAARPSPSSSALRHLISSRRAASSPAE